MGQNFQSQIRSGGEIGNPRSLKDGTDAFLHSLEESLVSRSITPSSANDIHPQESEEQSKFCNMNVTF